MTFSFYGLLSGVSSYAWKERKMEGAGREDRVGGRKEIGKKDKVGNRGGNGEDMEGERQAEGKENKVVEEEEEEGGDRK